jgi:hypothetical protein
MHAPEKTDRTSPLDELENYRRLVELQSQIIELARRNHETERSCRTLRQHVEREGLESITNGSRRRFPDPRWRLLQARPFRWLSRWADRLRRRNRSAAAPWTESPGQSTTLFSN